MTTIGEELDLVGVGLDYLEMDPFAVALRADGRRVRFYRSIKATVASIAESDREEAEAYAAFMQVAIPLVQALLPSIRGEAGVAPFSRRLVALIKALHHRPVDLMRDLPGLYDALLTRWLRSDLTRGPVSAFAAHASMGPNVPVEHSSRSGRRPTTSLGNGTPEAVPAP